MTEHLWEYDHPYYSSESNFFSRDYHTDYDSWAEFIQDEGRNDKDLNLLFRWDWDASYSYSEEDGVTPQTVEERRAFADRYDDDEKAWTLKLFFILQRKGIYRAVEVAVCKSDEPAVREFLAGYVAHLRLVWEPLLDERVTA